MEVSILVPIYNRIEITKVGLVSIKDALQKANSLSNFVKYSIVVIDDGSDDNSGLFITENHPDIHLLTGDGNLWWSGCINMGCKYAIDDLKADFVLLMNDDCVLDDNYFLNLSQLIINGEAKDKILASKVYYLKVAEKLFFYGASFNFNTGEKKIIAGGEIDTGQYEEPQECQWTGGMGVLIPVSVFKLIGYFDNINFPQYYGDADFTLRATKAGIKIYCRSELKLWNDRQATGFTHKGNIVKYLRSLSSIRSPYNIVKDYKFYTKFVPKSAAIKQIWKKHLSYLFKLVRSKLFFFLDFRLYLYNNFLNRIPVKFIRRWITRSYIDLGKNSNTRMKVEFLNNTFKKNIKIGNNCVVNPYCLLDGRKAKILIGNNVDIARGSTIYTLQHDPDSDYFETEAKDVIIEDYVWIGSRVIILPGVVIGRGAVIASGAVVTKNIPPMCVAGGIPAKVLRQRDSKLRYTLNDTHYFM